MKAPKKIYLAESDRYKGEVTSTFASSYPIGGGGNIEYIRKEALLEWAYKDLDPAAYLQLKNKLEEM